MLAEFVEGQFENVPGWFDAIDDPAKKVSLFIKFLEFYLPKMRSTQFTDVPDLVRFISMTTEERSEEIERIKTMIK